APRRLDVQGAVRTAPVHREVNQYSLVPRCGRIRPVMTKQLTVGTLLVFAGFALGRISAGSALVIAAPSEQTAAPHVYELRTYTAAEGRLPNLQARFRDHTLTIFGRHGIKSVGYWTPIERATAGTRR